LEQELETAKQRVTELQSEVDKARSVLDADDEARSRLENLECLIGITGWVSLILSRVRDYEHVVIQDDQKRVRAAYIASGKTEDESQKEAMKVEWRPILTNISPRRGSGEAVAREEKCGKKGQKVAIPPFDDYPRCYKKGKWDP
jgi:hypothetical protein